MSFLKKLFGIGGGGEAPAEAAGESIEHKGFTIRATPFKEGGQFQVKGVITKEIGGVVKEYTFIRVDRFADRQSADDLSLAKGRQIIDEQGERIFN